MGEKSQGLLQSAAEQDAQNLDDEAADKEDGQHEERLASQPMEPMSMLRLICINMHALGYGLFYASVGVLVSPPSPSSSPLGHTSLALSPPPTSAAARQKKEHES